jgi:transaldolase
VHLFLDSADLAAIRPYLRLPLVRGVTTNPTLQRRAGLREAALEGFVQSVLSEGARAVHVQVKSRETAAMAAEARRFAAWGRPGAVIPKLPATREGLAAISQLAADGIVCTVTAVFGPEQALWALLAGAAYAAPYLGRINEAGRDGFAVVAAMQLVLEGYASESPLLEAKSQEWHARHEGGRAGVAVASLPCRLLVASVRTRADFLALVELGVGAITVKPELLAELLDHRATLDAEAEFLADAESLR